LSVNSTRTLTVSQQHQLRRDTAADHSQRQNHRWQK
jgi:hypothetical protein